MTVASSLRSVAGTPMVVLTGDANRVHATKDMTQECRQIDILKPAVEDLICTG